MIRLEETPKYMPNDDLSQLWLATHQLVTAHNAGLVAPITTLAETIAVGDTVVMDPITSMLYSANSAQLRYDVSYVAYGIMLPTNQIARF